MKIFVSRQKYWGVEEEDGTVVECAIGGSDYANPDMLVAKWPSLGEGKEFNNPIEAVEAAIEICNEWRRTDPNAKVALGHTGGNTLPFDAEETYDRVQARAQKMYDKMPKCEHCGDILGKVKYGYEYGEYDCCSEQCADARYGDNDGESE